MYRRNWLKSILALCILACACTITGANAESTVPDQSAALISDNAVMAALISGPTFQGNGREADVEAVAAAAVEMYDRAAAEQAVPNAAQLKAMDQAVQAAENKINIVLPLKYNRALQLQKLLAYVLDRLIWGGSLAAAGFAASWLAGRSQTKSRILMGASMVLFGCAYALLLPIIAVGVVCVGSLWAIRSWLIASLSNRCAKRMDRVKEFHSTTVSVEGIWSPSRTPVDRTSRLLLYFRQRTGFARRSE